MNIFSKHSKVFLLRAIFGGWVAFSLISCQKAQPNAASDPAVGAPNTIAYPTFSAAVNGSLSPSSFTPAKQISGGNTSLIGTSAYYTITITFPSSTGPGRYDIGQGSPGYTASITTGSDTYYVNASNGLGALDITSIAANGEYTGTFNFTGWDSSNNFLTVNQGTFSNL
jgi:hypothetical protein